MDKKAFIWQDISKKVNESQIDLRLSNTAISYSVYKVLSNHTNYVYCLAQLNDQQIATGSYYEKIANIWNQETGDVQFTIRRSHKCSLVFI